MKGSSTRRSLFLVSSIALAVSASNAFAGGYEKATLWDAKYSALAGAATSSVNDSSAIFFNPAGLAFAKSDDFSLHVSPTFSRIDGPASGADTFSKGEKLFSPAGGFTGLYKLNDQLILGYGIYAAGGANSEYKGITAGQGSLAVTGTYSTKIKIIESGLALGYRVNKNWSVGATYRLTYAYADLNMVAPIPGALIGAPAGTVAGLKVGYNDMEGWNKSAFRLGAMYRSNDNHWGWGINYRSEVEINAEGEATEQVGPKTLAKQDVTGTTALPMQISTGVDYSVTPDWTVFGEVTYSKYSDNDKITFEGDSTGVKVPQLNINWEDQYNYRVAAEYTGINDWALRGGYIYTTAVVPDDYAAPTFSTPGTAHTVTFGAGTSVLDDKIDLDFGADYSKVKNNHARGGGKPTPSSPTSPSGKYESYAYALHMSATYKF